MDLKAGLLLLAFYMAWEHRDALRILRRPGREEIAEGVGRAVWECRKSLEMMALALGERKAAALASLLTALGIGGLLLLALCYYALAAALIPNPAWRAFTLAAAGPDLWSGIRALKDAPALLRGDLEAGDLDPAPAWRLWACEGLPFAHALAAAGLVVLGWGAA